MQNRKYKPTAGPGNGQSGTNDWHDHCQDHANAAELLKHIFDFPGNVSSDTLGRQNVVRCTAGILSGEGLQLNILTIG